MKISTEWRDAKTRVNDSRNPSPCDSLIVHSNLFMKWLNFISTSPCRHLMLTLSTLSNYGKTLCSITVSFWNELCLMFVLSLVNNFM